MQRPARVGTSGRCCPAFGHTHSERSVQMHGIAVAIVHKAYNTNAPTSVWPKSGWFWMNEGLLSILHNWNKTFLVFTPNERANSCQQPSLKWPSLSVNCQLPLVNHKMVGWASTAVCKQPTTIGWTSTVRSTTRHCG